MRGRYPKQNSFSSVAASPHQAFSRDTMYGRRSPHTPVSGPLSSTNVSSVGCDCGWGIGMYPGRMSYSVGMSVEPWMFAWPRSARMPPPGLPMLPSSSCTIEAARMFCTPTVCWVHPTA